MNEQHQPINIGKEEIKPYKTDVEELIENYPYKGSQSLHDMMLEINPEENVILGEHERYTYMTVREGLQIFKKISSMLSEKTDLRSKIATSTDVATDSEIRKLKNFCYGYATFAASSYVSKKLEFKINENLNGEELTETTDMAALQYPDMTSPEKAVLRHLMVPIYHNLIKQKNEKGEVFKTDLEFPIFVKEVFDKYKELSLANRIEDTNLDKNIEGYDFRIMDDFLVLNGYDDKSTTKISVKQDLTFQPITSKEIVGNQQGKRKISRYIDRQALYNVTEQKNPILELGGLSWSNLFDGPPGTGKTSLFRFAMTKLQERCEMTGMPYNIFVVDQSIKDEYYGKTGKILLDKISVSKDPHALTIGIMDDIDLLTSTRSDAQGADNDINNIIMQYLDGAFTVRRGNVINFAASNKPTGLDDAMRNRFNDRLLIDGPVTSEDFADVFMLHGGALIENNLINIDTGYEPFATQDIQTEDGKWTCEEDVSEYMAEEMLTKYQNASVIEFGKFMADLKKENPKITGRSSKAIMDAIKERSANFDIENEWFEDSTIFRDKPYKTQVNMLSELYTKITPDVLFQEAQRYFDSEERFAKTEADEMVVMGYNNRKWNDLAELKYLEDNETIENKARRDELLLRMQRFDDEVNETMVKAIGKAKDKALQNKNGE